MLSLIFSIFASLYFLYADFFLLTTHLIPSLHHLVTAILFGLILLVPPTSHFNPYSILSSFSSFSSFRHISFHSLLFRCSKFLISCLSISISYVWLLRRRNPYFLICYNRFLFNFVCYHYRSNHFMRISSFRPDIFPCFICFVYTYTIKCLAALLSSTNVISPLDLVTTKNFLSVICIL